MIRADVFLAIQAGTDTTMALRTNLRLSKASAHSALAWLTRNEYIASEGPRNLMRWVCLKDRPPEPIVRRKTRDMKSALCALEQCWPVCVIRESDRTKAIDLGEGR